MTTYSIKPRQQYDEQGVRVEYGALVTNYTRDGKYDSGHYSLALETEPLLSAIHRVLVTREPEIITIGGPPAPSTAAKLPAACKLYTPEQGCPLHGELCAPDYE